MNHKILINNFHNNKIHFQNYNKIWNNKIQDNKIILKQIIILINNKNNNFNIHQ